MTALLKTHALSRSSSARNRVAAINCPSLDQRGEVRDVDDGFCDAGAFESEFEPETSFFVVPLPSGKTVMFGNNKAI